MKYNRLMKMKKYITAYFEGKYNINRADCIYFEYGINVFVSDFINFTAVFMMGLLLEKMLFTIFFLLAFSSLRLRCGGFHFSRRITCFCGFCCCYLLCVIFAYYIEIPFYLLTDFVIVTCGYIIAHTPVCSINNPLSQREITYNKFISIVMSSFYVLIMIMLYPYYPIYAKLIGFIIVEIAFLLFVAIKRNRNKHEIFSIDN